MAGEAKSPDPSKGGILHRLKKSSSEEFVAAPIKTSASMVAVVAAGASAAAIMVAGVSALWKALPQPITFAFWALMIVFWLYVLFVYRKRQDPLLRLICSLPTMLTINLCLISTSFLLLNQIHEHKPIAAYVFPVAVNAVLYFVCVILVVEDVGSLVVGVLKQSSAWTISAMEAMRGALGSTESSSSAEPKS